MTAPLPLAASIAIRCLGYAATRETAQEWLRLAAYEGAPPDVLADAWTEWTELHDASVQRIEVTS